jgi:hypothetical protein
MQSTISSGHFSMTASASPWMTVFKVSFVIL